MADPFNGEIEVGPPPVTMRKRRSLAPVFTILFLLILGAAGGFVWLNYDNLIDMARAATAGGSGTPVLASAPENAVSSSDFAAFQQQTTGSLQSATDLLAAQQAQLKQLADQIQGLTTQVAGLTSKIDQIQGRPAASAVVPVPPPAAIQAAAVPVRAAPAAVRKKPPAASHPVGAISVGGAPLPQQPAR